MSLGQEFLTAITSIFLLAALVSAGAIITFFAMWVVELGEMAGRSWLGAFRTGLGK